MTRQELINNIMDIIKRIQGERGGGLPLPEKGDNMNRVIKVIYDKVEITETYAPMTVNIVCHTEGDPDGVYWVWEVSEHDLKDYFRDEPEVGYNIHNEDLLIGDAERFVNDEDILEDSDEYDCGKEPVIGCWYAPLTMDEINRIYGE